MERHRLGPFSCGRILLGERVSRGEAFCCDGKSHTMGYIMKVALGCCSGREKGESVEAVEGEGRVRGTGTKASFPSCHFEQ
jgi:hypothetical protein